MIITFIRDGLGNQMFLYAFARTLQLKYNEKLLLNIGMFKRDKQRSYSLSHCKLNPEIKVLSKKRSSLQMNLFWRYYALKNMKPENDEMVRKLNKLGIYMQMDVYSFHEYIYTNRRFKFLFGNFQNPRYFKDIKDVLCDELAIVTPPSSENEKKIREISACNSVCVHIRRGDYVTDSRWSRQLQICNYEYYNKAIEMMKKKVSNPVFYVFTNSHEDIEWIKQNYKFDCNIIYIDLNNPDYEELRLMYTCKHFIISNSTFSWWAQYLSKNNDKIVIAPNKWINDYKVDCNDIYMDNWDLINVD